MRDLVCRLEEETGMFVRFAVGEVPGEAREEIDAEQAEHGTFLHIPLKVTALPLLKHQQRCIAL